MANYTIVVVTEISDLDDFALTVNSLIDPQRGGKRNLRWNGEPPKRFKSSQSCFVFRAGKKSFFLPFKNILYLLFQVSLIEIKKTRIDSLATSWQNTRKRNSLSSSQIHTLNLLASESLTLFHIAV